MININDLFTTKEQKEKHKEEIYDNVLQQCHRKIFRSVKLNPYSNICFYIIPKIIYGVPLYNLEKSVIGGGENDSEIEPIYSISNSNSSFCFNILDSLKFLEYE